MANEAINTYLVGYSSRATNPDFLEEMIEVRKKEARNFLAKLYFIFITKWRTRVLKG